MNFSSIKKKFLLVFIIISVIPIIIVTIISYESYTSLVSKQVSAVSSNIISNSIDRIDSVFENMDRITSIFTYQYYSPDKTIADELKKYSGDTASFNQYDLFLSRKNIQFICENLMNDYGYINGVYLFIPNGDCFSYGRVTDLKVGYKPFEDEWYKKTLQDKGKLYISDVSKKDFIINSTQSITFSRAIYDMNSHKFLGVLMIDCGLDIFKDLDKDIVSNETNLYLVNENDKILFDSSKSKIGTYLSTDISFKISGQAEGNFMGANNTLTVFKSSPDYNWKVLAVISINELDKEFDATGKLIIFIALTCSLILILLSYILSKQLTRPITELSDHMSKNKSHELISSKKHLERKDEIGILYNEYNNMIDEINTFIKERYQNRLITLDSQMKALEAQINSHFLYNTLESINSIAEIEEVESIAIISKALGDMFRYAIKTNSELVTVEQELAHVTNYLEIQRIRYDNKFTYVFDLQEDLKKEKILKLILQPLVENALYHGLEGKRGHGELKLSGWLDGNLLFLEVSDNGLGTTKEQVDEINKLLNQSPKITDLGRRDKQSIGIKNIHSRIQLYYGTNYGLTFESRENIGTAVRICVPRL